MNYYITKTIKSLDLVKQLLTFKNPAYEKANRLGIPKARYMRPTLSLYRIEKDKIVIPFGTFYYLANMMGKTYKAKPKEIIYDGDVELYDYQVKAVDYLARTNNCLLISGTGSGKTQMGIALIKRLGLRTLWITHTQDLLDQSKNRFKQYFNNEIGEIAEGKVNIQDMTFALIQTLSKIDLDLYKDLFDVIIIDEVQHLSTNITNTTMYEKVLSKLNANYRYGLTATLHRADGLEKVIEELISHDKYIVEEKDLKKLKAKINNVYYKEKVEKVVVGIDEYTNHEIYSLPYLDTDGTINYTKLINYLTSDNKRTMFIVNLVKSLKDKKVMILTHRKALCERLNALLDNSIYLASNLSRNKRIEVIEAFKENRYKVFIATYQLAREGLDIPMLDTLVLATPIKDEAVVIQSIGRIERTWENKVDPEVYDIVDTDIAYCLGLKKQRNKILKRYKYVVE